MGHNGKRTPEEMKKLGAKTAFDSDRARAASIGRDKQSVRRIVKMLGATEINMEDTKALAKLAKGRGTLSFMIALKSFNKAISGDMRAVEYVTDQIDGKLKETYNAPPPVVPVTVNNNMHKATKKMIRAEVKRLESEI